jgi:hypothetical protein
MHMPVATTPVAREAPAEPALRDDHAVPPELPVRRAGGGGDGQPGHGGGDGGGRRGWPPVLAVIAIVLLAAALTFVGMVVGGIWANLSGAQLPAA